MDDITRLATTSIIGTEVSEGDTLLRGSDLSGKSRKPAQMVKKPQVDEKIEPVKHALDSTA